MITVTLTHTHSLMLLMQDYELTHFVQFALVPVVYSLEHHQHHLCSNLDSYHGSYCIIQYYLL